MYDYGELAVFPYAVGSVNIGPGYFEERQVGGTPPPEYIGDRRDSECEDGGRVA